VAERGGEDIKKILRGGICRRCDTVPYQLRPRCQYGTVSQNIAAAG
jgi:hypothetical protein